MRSLNNLQIHRHNLSIAHYHELYYMNYITCSYNLVRNHTLDYVVQSMAVYHVMIMIVAAHPTQFNCKIRCTIHTPFFMTLSIRCKKTSQK